MKTVGWLFFIVGIFHLSFCGLIYAESIPSTATLPQPDNQSQYIRHLESQIKFCNVVINAFALFISLLAITIVIGGVLLYKDRKSMRDEIVEESKYIINKKTRDFEKQWQEIFDELNRRKSEMTDQISSLITNAKRQLDNFCAEMKTKLTAVEQEEKTRLIERIGEIEREISSKVEAILKPSTPTGIETNKEREAREMLKNGNEFLDKQNFDNAISCFTQAIKLNPSYADAYNNRGVAYFNKDEFDKAIADYTKAIEINPNDADIYINRGIAYFNKGEFDKAIADWTKAIEINPNLAQAYYNRGVAYFNKGEFDKAIADYTKAIEINPKYANAMAMMGKVYQQKGDKGKAKYWYEQALRYKENLEPWQITDVQTWLKELEGK